MQIRYLKHCEIDFTKWDYTISKSSNKLVYAFSWYLDIVSPNWGAIVSENYEFVMPVTLKQKFLISYIVQPILTQQLGIFSHHEITEKITKVFVKKIPILSYEINLNEKNPTCNSVFRPNYILDLNKDYSILKKQYSKNTLRNITKSSKSNVVVKHGIDINSFCQLNNSIKRSTDFNIRFILEKLIKEGVSKQTFVLYGAYSNNQLIAVLCTIETTDRIIYLYAISNDEGKACSASFLIVDELIRKHANNPVLLDFEGSSIDGIANFFKGFGAVNHPYPVIKRLRPASLLEKIRMIH